MKTYPWDVTIFVERRQSRLLQDEIRSMYKIEVSLNELLVKTNKLTK